MNVIVDTGFWYSFLGTREQVRHSVAEVVFGKLNNLYANFLVPFPTLYEAINTKLLKDKFRDKADWFLKQLQSNPHFIRIPDDEYKAKAYDLTIEENYRGFSLVDNVIRVMMQDPNLKIHALLTFNIDDFIDIAAKRGIEIPNELYGK